MNRDHLPAAATAGKEDDVVRSRGSILDTVDGSICEAIAARERREESTHRRVLQNTE